MVNNLQTLLNNNAKYKVPVKSDTVKSKQRISSPSVSSKNNFDFLSDTVQAFTSQVSCIGEQGKLNIPPQVASGAVTTSQGDSKADTCQMNQLINESKLPYRGPQRMHVSPAFLTSPLTVFRLIICSLS